MEGSSSISNDGFTQIMLKAALEAVPILTEENYSMWKDKISILLELKNVKTALEDETKQLNKMEDIEVRVIILSKIDSITHTNVVTPENINSAKLLWKSIKERFALSQTANQAQIFNKFLYQEFRTEDIPFITQTKISIKKMADVGIDLPDDIVAYLLLFKFPPQLHLLRQQIMHSDKEITVDLVLNHLTQLNNKKKSKISKSKSHKTALITSERQKPSVPKDQRCRKGFHNPKSKDHPEERCWHKYKNLAPDWWKEAQAKWRAQFNHKDREVAHYHALVTTWIENISTDYRIILDSGASCHMFNSKAYFTELNKEIGDSISTGKEGANLPILGKGTVKLSWRSSHITLSNCFYVPELVINLISPGELIAEKNCQLESRGQQFKLLREDKLVFSGYIKENLFVLNMPKSIGNGGKTSYLTRKIFTPEKLMHLHLSLSHASPH